MKVEIIIMEDTRELSLVISNPEQGQFLTRIEWNKDEFKELAQTKEGAAVFQPAQDPFANPPKPKRYKASFTVIGSLEEIQAVKQFMVDNGVHFEKGVK